MNQGERFKVVVPDTRHRANSGQKLPRVSRAAGMMLALAMGGCAAGEGQPSLHDVPAAPALAPVESRLELGDALLGDRERARIEGEALRHEVGKGPPPAPAAATEVMPRPAAPRGPGRPENIEAIYVEERVAAETADTSLGDFLRRLANPPRAAGMEPGTSDPAPATPAVTRGPRALSGPETPVPLLDRLLAAAGLTEAPPVQAD